MTLQRLLSTRTFSFIAMGYALALGGCAWPERTPSSSVIPAQSPPKDVALSAHWDDQPDAPWLGADFWCNRTQDWRVEDGRVLTNPNAMKEGFRSAFVMTRQLTEHTADFSITVETGVSQGALNQGALTGLVIGAGRGEMDPRGAAMVQWHGHGAGFFCGVNASGHAFIHDNHKPINRTHVDGKDIPAHLKLVLKGSPVDKGQYLLDLTASDAVTGEVLSTAQRHMPAADVRGMVAMAASPGNNQAAFWFDNLALEGDAFTPCPQYAFGPVAGIQYTLSDKTLKLTAQMVPVGDGAAPVELQVQDSGRWRTVATTDIVTPGYTAPLRVENWDDQSEHAIRVVYDGHSYPGLVRRNPTEQDDISVGMINCMHQNSHALLLYNWGGGTAPAQDWIQGMWFPHAELTNHMLAANPDIMFYAGDQLYEGGSPTNVDKTHYELDYLYKWYLFSRTMEDLTRSRPTVTLPDDHDVFQGNLWGASGRKAFKHDKEGGYLHPAWWVNMVERTQTSHLPDPVDPQPVKQDIGVYFTEMNYGNIGFAILEDRKFKSSPLDKGDLTLLGDRQLAFLERWSGNWSGHQQMKAVLSQTVFAQANTHSGAKLKPMVLDTDTNGFPKSGRDKAVDTIRRGFAVHLCGDQHLGTLLRHGVDEFDDAMLSFCGPSAGNYWPRAWNPAIKDRHFEYPKKDSDYLGPFVEAHGNKITMLAAANPGKPTGLLPTDLYDRVPGYGITTFHKADQKITFACYPRHVAPGGKQYPGWPQTFKLADNYARKPSHWLPAIQISGLADPVIQIKQGDQLVWARRIRGTSIRPGVFSEGHYTISVGEPGSSNWQIFKHVPARRKPGKRQLNAAF